MKSYNKFRMNKGPDLAQSKNEKLDDNSKQKEDDQ